MCAKQIEEALREQIAENEFKLKAFKNAGSLLQNIQEKQGKTNIGVGFDYDTIRKKKGHVDMSEDKVVHENAPHILKNASKPLFKPSTIDIDEEAILIKQLIIDEDEDTESVKVKTKAPTKNQSVKPVKPNTESAKIEGKKKKQNRNGKVGITKDSNYVHIRNAPRKTCQNCFSTNHLTYACTKAEGSVAKPFYDSSVPLKYRDSPFCDKFDCMPCNMNVMTSCFNLRKQFIDGCISHNSHTHYTRPKSSSPPKARKVPLSPKSENSNSKTSNSDKKTEPPGKKHVNKVKTVSKATGPKLFWVPKK